MKLYQLMCFERNYEWQNNKLETENSPDLIKPEEALIKSDKIKPIFRNNFLPSSSVLKSYITSYLLDNDWDFP